MRVAFCLALFVLPIIGMAQVVIGKGLPITIYAASDASAPEQVAARDLALWLGKVTGQMVPIRNEPANASALASNAILVGAGKLARSSFPDVPFDKLGDEEVVLKSKGQLLLVAGGRPRGTVYAVDRLLYRAGFRFWTPWATAVPSKTVTFADLHVQEKPKFEARDPFWFHAFDRDWARRNASNSMHSHLTEEDGGRIDYEGFVHTFYPLVPPAEHFAAHPEWYSLIDGKRTADRAQLCTTNPELRKFIVEQVRAKLKANPSVRIVSISQNDWYGACQCDNCKAIDDAEGTPAGSVLALANYVAADIEKDYPNVAIDTLAYQYTRKAPLHLRPRPNVIVRLCSIECSFSQPLTDPMNASFAKDIRDWSRLTDRLYVWNYVTDFPNYMVPFPNWYVIGPNERFFAANGVKGLFEQGAYQSYGSSMAELQAWLQAQLLWNPEQDDRALIREFCEGYYGPAAKPIMAYLDVMAAAAKPHPMTIWTGPDSDIFTYEAVMESERLWQQALAAVRGKPDLEWRVKLGQLPIRYLIISRWQALRSESDRRKVKWPLSDSRKKVVDEWMAVATSKGPEGWQPITHMNESGLTPQAWAARYATDPVRFVLPDRAPSAPLPADLALPPNPDVIDLQDDEAKLYGEGDMSETRPDPAASDGIAVRMPNTHHEWAFQLPLAKAPAKALVGKWKVVVVVRVEGGDPEADAFTAGVYDSAKAVSLASVAGKADPKYRSLLLGEFALSKGATIWVAPFGSGTAKAIWVDRVLLVRSRS
jgi:hypothetical protein